MPTVKAYRQALEQLWPKFAPSHRRLLLAHYAARAHTTSMGALAEAVGYKAYHSANLHYGTLAARIGKKVGIPPGPDHDNLFAVATWPAKAQRQNSAVQLTMRPQLVTALEQLHLVDTTPSLHIVLGGIQNGDQALVERRGRNGKGTANGWIAPKSAKVGDDVALFFIGGSGILATAKIAGDAYPADDWPNRYRASLSSIQLIDPPISLGALRKHVPDLKWVNYPRSITTPAPAIAQRLRELIKERRRGKPLALSDADAPDINLAELRHLAIQGSQSRLAAATKSVRYRQASEAVRRYVLGRAAGVCEGCGKPGPFVDSSGKAYLEAHHLTRRADEGPDHPSHVIGLCPNCHRKAHYAADHQAFNTRLKNKVRRLER